MIQLLPMVAMLEWMEKHKWASLVGILLVIGVLAHFFTSLGGPSSQTATPQASAQAPQAPSLSAADAQAQFKDLMDLSEKGNLVSSYKFDDTDRVIYVTDVWYTMTVAFKKDFLAKVGMLQDAASGKHFFEVRDEHSNEKVGEVTAFSGALEVYK
jgi:hypothetical protein